jgi:hypothetical protein
MAASSRMASLDQLKGIEHRDIRQRRRIAGSGQGNQTAQQQNEEGQIGADAVIGRGKSRHRPCQEITPKFQGTEHDCGDQAPDGQRPGIGQSGDSVHPPGDLHGNCQDQQPETDTVPGRQHLPRQFFFKKGEQAVL